MPNHANVEAGCRLIGEFVDDAEAPSGIQGHSAEVVRPLVLKEFLDLWGNEEGTREFTVLLKDGRVVAVRGHNLTQLPSSINGESGAYGVVVRAGGEELLVGLFKMVEVVGIFHGELRLNGHIA